MIDRAQKATPLTAIQNIYSMAERDSRQPSSPCCMAHDIGFAPLSPITSGMLSGKIALRTQFESYDDVRNWLPKPQLTHR